MCEGRIGERADRGMLLHVCCAPCSTHCIELLREEGWRVHALFYNPNIYPREEYEQRMKETRDYCEERGISMEVGDYDNGDWEGNVQQFARLGEGSRRCAECFRHRLRRAAGLAKELGLDAFTTTLTVSPHKDSRTVFRVGAEMAEEFGIEFAEYNFKKKDGFKRSVEMSCRYGLTRQDYCGCRYSLRERRERSENRQGY